MREGFAEWVACRVTASLGLESFDSLRDNLLEQLGAPQVGLRPAPFDKLATFPQWVEAQGRYDTPLYAQAFIAAELLVEKQGVAAMIRYFEVLQRHSGLRAGLRRHIRARSTIIRTPLHAPMAGNGHPGQSGTLRNKQLLGDSRRAYASR